MSPVTGFILGVTAVILVGLVYGAVHCGKFGFITFCT